MAFPRDETTVSFWLLPPAFLLLLLRCSSKPCGRLRGNGRWLDHLPPLSTTGQLGQRMDFCVSFVAYRWLLRRSLGAINFINHHLQYACAGHGDPATKIAVVCPLSVLITAFLLLACPPVLGGASTMLLD